MEDDALIFRVKGVFIPHSLEKGSFAITFLRRTDKRSGAIDPATPISGAPNNERCASINHIQLDRLAIVIAGDVDREIYLH